jgi:hypothetical protein
MDRSRRIEFKIWEAQHHKKFVHPRLDEQIDISRVPEEKRDAGFEEELKQFRIILYRDSLSAKWLFRLALHEGSHLWRMRKSGRDCTLQGPHMDYREGAIKWVKGSISSRAPLEYTYEFIMSTLKEWLAGPLAVSFLTGEKEDPEPDILAACKFLELPREKVKEYLWLAEPELEEELRSSVVVQEILDCAREYAKKIFHNDACIDWGIKRYRLEGVKLDL